MSTESSSVISPAHWRKQEATSSAGLKRTVVTLHDQSVELLFPDCIEADVKFLFPGSSDASASPAFSITIDTAEDGQFSIRSRGEILATKLNRVELPIWLAEEVTELLITAQEEALALHAAAVAWNGATIVLPGASGAGKSSLATWLVDRGFEYLSDEITLVMKDHAVLGLPRAVVVKPQAAAQVQSLPLLQQIPLIKYGKHLLFSPRGTEAPHPPQPCGILLFPHFRAGAALQIDVLTAAETGMRLVACNLNARNFPDGGFAEITKLARTVPALSVEYGEFGQLEDKLEAVLRLAIEKQFAAAELRQFTSAFIERAPVPAVPAPAKTYPIQPATPRSDFRPKLTVGMATYDDYDGAYFSIQALRLYHPEVIADIELVVIDNHPDGPCGEALKRLEGATPNYRYVPNDSRRSTTARGFIFHEAAGEFVLCIDSHVFVVPGALKRLLDYFHANPSTADLLQGPLLYDDLTTISTHFTPQWQAGMYGVWQCDDRGVNPEAPPFEIQMQGLGLFACRREAWPGFNPEFRGFGGEEGYIHEKFRQRGGRALCLPFLRWMHRFERPFGVPYRNIWEDRIRNYMIGFRELGIDTQELQEHFITLLGPVPAKAIFATIHQELDA